MLIVTHMNSGHRQETGSMHLALLLGVVVLAVIGIVGWRVMSAEDKQPTAQQTTGKSEESTAPEADIVLQNFGLASLASVDVTTQALREYESKGLKGFYAFGESLSGGRINPNFEFASLKAGAKVVAAIDGVIGFVKEQPESKDYEVFLQPKENSKWTIGYDHLVNVTVAQGAMVKAGDVLGEPAMQNNGLTRFEIQVNKDENGKTTHLCPSSLVSDGQLLKELAGMMSDWETTSGIDLYTFAETDLVGCKGQTTLTPEQAEGR